MSDIVGDSSDDEAAAAAAVLPPRHAVPRRLVQHGDRCIAFVTASWSGRWADIACARHPANWDAPLAGGGRILVAIVLTRSFSFIDMAATEASSAMAKSALRRARCAAHNFGFIANRSDEIAALNVPYVVEGRRLQLTNVLDEMASIRQPANRLHRPCPAPLRQILMHWFEGIEFRKIKSGQINLHPDAASRVVSAEWGAGRQSFTPTSEYSGKGGRGAVPGAFATAPTEETEGGGGGRR